MFSIPTTLWFTGLVLIAAALWDVGTRTIPDAFPLVLLAWALIARLTGLQRPEWDDALLGLGLGFLIGFLFFSLGVMGGGDGKLLAGLGAVLGPVGLLATLPWMAALGGIAALWARRRGEKEVAYGPAIALGYLLAVLV